ncbi:hypothetical protein BCR24_13915 [Enterococcus ureilyticus]|uniref:DUF5067 domain-containing protein n=2 Tax=Enterococcus ureilyticus TaxID=1131292 RepID=A0A1E5HDC1_9ENTE|nr:hypothetical protein BCR24_13915 [Enterococcus ureilyticus]
MMKFRKVIFMKTRKILFSIALLMCLSNIIGCSAKKTWSFSEKENTFIGNTAKIKIKKEEKIPLSGGGYAVRVYYKVTNLDSKKTDGYSLILQQINGLYQDGKELDSATIVGAEVDDAETAVTTEIEPEKTEEVYVDYSVINYESEIEISFSEDGSSEERAKYTFKPDNLSEANTKGLFN